MKVGVYYNNNDVRVEERPIPEIGDNDILLKVMASGICGSDLMEFHRIKKAPFVPGHELSGIIEEAGKDVEYYKAGDRIFVTHHVPCDNCIECNNGYGTQCEDFKKINNFEPGGFAEYIKVGGRSLKTGVIKLPHEMTYEQASFIEPVGTVVESANFPVGGTILLFGSGVAGILNMQLAKSYGTGRIIATDINLSRLEFAKELGADYVINAREYTPERLREMNRGRLADKVIICTGAKSATEQAFKSYEQGGDILFFATPKEKEEVPMDWYDHWRNGLTINFTYGATPESNLVAARLITEGSINVDDMITHRLSLEEIAEGFKIASRGEGLKVIIEPNEI